ncbi:MAG TPA: peptidylprolyl isomerase [Anaerolineales bacterium]|nr:peptidylprolyl isomerase [Anaerolineales bacterium]
MPRDTGKPHLTRKHLARAQRERMLARWIVGGVALVIVVALGLLVYGWLDVNYFQPARPAVTVNGEAISYRELAARLRMAQASLLNQRLEIEQTYGFLADNPETRAILQQQIDQINAQLSDTPGLSLRVLGQIIDARLIRQEAQRRGIHITQEDVDKTIAEAFGFFPEGTPTTAPTPTVDATLAAQATTTWTPAPTSTPTEGPSPTARPSSTATLPATQGPTPTASSTATPYTRDLFEEDYQTYLDDLKNNLNVSEDVIRRQFEEDLYRERLRASVQASTPRDVEQVWAKHILVDNQAVAFALLSRFRQGEAWDALAAEFSTDSSNKDRGGDLGWFSRGAMVDAFEEAAFSAPVGEVTGPVQTGFGWHLILVLGHETRRLDDAAFQSAIDQALAELVQSLRDTATLVYDEPLRTPTPTPSVTPAPVSSPTVAPVPPG